MTYLILIGLFFVIYLDSRLLKQRDKRLFEEIFCVSRRFLFLVFILLLAVLSVSEDRWEVLPSLVLIFILPFYLLRRVRFVKSVGTGLPVLADRPGKPVPTDLPVPAGTEAQRASPPAILVSDALGVIIAWFFSLLVLTIFLKGIVSFFPLLQSELAELLLSAVFSSVIALILIYKASKKFSTQGFLTNMALRLGNRSVIKVVLLPSLMGTFFACLSTFVIWAREVQPPTPLGDILEATQSSTLLLIFILIAVFAAPLIEEIIFRGYFFYVIRQAKGEKFAIYCIALIFAFLHVSQYWGDWAAIGMVTILGFSLTILRAWTGTTIASAVMHYIYNAGVTILPVLMIG